MRRRGAVVFERREAEDKRILNTDLQPAAQQRIRPDTGAAPPHTPDTERVLLDRHQRLA